MLRDMCRTFADTELAPNAGKWLDTNIYQHAYVSRNINTSINSLNLARNISRVRDQAHEFPVNAIKQMAEMGEFLIYRANMLN
jgi:hypothetical protein